DECCRAAGLRAMEIPSEESGAGFYASATAISRRSAARRRPVAPRPLGTRSHAAVSVPNSALPRAARCTSRRRARARRLHSAWGNPRRTLEVGLASRPDERFRIRFRSLAMKLAVSIALLLSSSIVATTAAQVSRPAALPGDELVAAAAGDQRTPVLSAGSDSILAVWQDQRSSPMTSGQQSGFDLFAVRLDALGLPIDPLPFPITMAGGLQSTPRVAWNGSAWLVAWVG